MREGFSNLCPIQTTSALEKWHATTHEDNIPILDRSNVIGPYPQSRGFSYVLVQTRSGIIGTEPLPVSYLPTALDLVATKLTRHYIPIGSYT